MNRAAIYARLSKEDLARGKTLEGTNSDSIETQLSILKSYAKKNNLCVIDKYIDDGFTGTNFDRPDFTRLISDVEDRKIDTVIVKDFSRLGRNYLEVGRYLEEYFPENGIRVIAINDHYDSADVNSFSDDMVPIQNVFNDKFAKDTSKKVRSTFKDKTKNGEYIGRGIYGYKRSTADRHKLEVDELTAPIVRRIFDMAASGYGYGKIARVLQSECIPNPASIKGKAPKKEYYTEFTWHLSTVRKILNDEVYLGHMVQLKVTKVSYRSKKIKKRNPEEWAVVRNTHEAIISQSTWDTVQAVLATKRKPCKNGEPHIFTGLLRCSTCGAPLAKNGSKGPAFACSVYKKQGKEFCDSHRITMGSLSAAVLASIQSIIQYVQIDKQGFIEKQSGKNVSQSEKILEALEKKRDQKKRRHSKFPELLQKAFEQNAAEIMTDTEYYLLIGRYREEKARIEKELFEIERRVNDLKQSENKTIDFVALVEKYSEVTELNSTLVHELIEKIVVHPVEKIDGQKHQRIDVHYRFIGVLKG